MSAENSKVQIRQQLQGMLGGDIDLKFSNISLKSLYYLVNTSSLLNEDKREDLKIDLAIGLPSNILDMLFNAMLAKEIDYLDKYIPKLKDLFTANPKDPELEIIINELSERLNKLKNLTDSSEVFAIKKAIDRF